MGKPIKSLRRRETASTRLSKHFNVSANTTFRALSRAGVRSNSAASTLLDKQNNLL